MTTDREPAAVMRGRSGGARDPRRRSAIEQRSRRAELLAVGLMTLKGYRVLALRARTSAGEIDIVAVRGKRLAFVEVKQRPSLDDAATSVTWQKAERLRRAASAWLQAYPAYRNHRIGMDRCDVAGLIRVRHVPDALQIMSHGIGPRD